jgi:hypothetical protein
MAAVPKPQPKDWLAAAADELRQGDKATLALLQESYRNVNTILKGLPSTPDAPFGNLIYRAQLERTRRELLKEQADLFDRLGDRVSARRLRSASRAAKLSAAANAALLKLVGQDEEGQRLYAGADITAQRTIETLLARAKLSAVPLAERIYNTKSWMNKRLDSLIVSTMAKGLNAQRFAKVARDWFSPSVPGGTRYAAMRLARTEINNAFHATSISYAQDKPWVSQMDWNLSKSHPKPDKCNEYSAASPWDVYAIPRKPHPQCMCYVTEVTPDEDEWIDRFVNGEFDGYLDGELAKADAALGINNTAPETAPETVKATSTWDKDAGLQRISRYKNGDQLPVSMVGIEDLFDNLTPGDSKVSPAEMRQIGTVEEIDLAGKLLLSNQDHASVSRVRHYLNEGIPAGNNGLPNLTVLPSGAIVIKDGNHRVVASLLANQTKVVAHVNHLDLLPKPKPKPAPSNDGYNPGAWALQSDKEAAISEIEQSLLKVLPPDQLQNARKLAEEFVKETADTSEIEFRNGPHTVRFTGNLSEEQRQTFLGNVDELQTKAPAGRNLHILVAPSSEFEFGVGGETTLATGYMRINEAVFKRDVWPGMPVSSNVSPVMYVLAHEWGHAFPSKEDARDQTIHRHSISAGGMTRYGKTAPEESYAEAFAEWILTNGKTTNQAALEYAERFNWGERFGI